MAIIHKHKRSSVALKVPLVSDLDYGEFALNYTDEKLYFKNSSNAIKSFIALTGLKTVNGVSLDGVGNASVNTNYSLVFSNSGNGAASGSTFNGSNLVTLSYNTLGAAPLASPALTGTPTVPTAAVGTNTTQIASTAFVKSAQDIILSRGNNLVANGNGGLGTLYNWNSVTAITNDTPTGAKQAFRSTGSGSQNNITTSEFIPVDPNKKYYTSIAWKQLNAGVSARAYMYLAPYDAAGYSIQPNNYMEQLNTRTTLALPLNNGDTTVTLTSAANWWNSTSDHRSSIIFWNWTDSFGKVWPPGTYSRHYWTAGQWAAGGITGNVITLKAPWTGGNFPAGHVVGNGSSGGSYMYPISQLPIPETWTTYVGTLCGGIHTDITAAATYAFPIATAAVAVGMLTDYNATGGTSQIISANVYMSDVFTPTIDQLDVTGVSKTAKKFYASPAAVSGAPTFRDIVASDIPTLNQNTTGSSGSLTMFDTRSVNNTPQSYSAGTRFDFKENTTDGLSDGGTYHGVMTYRNYASGSDWSGGGVRQVAFTDNHNLFVRGANADTTWSAWKQVAYTSSNITGTAAGNLLLTGGTLTGKITFNTAAVDAGGNTGIVANVNGWTRFDPNGSRFLVPLSPADVATPRYWMNVERTDTWATLMGFRTDGSAVFSNVTIAGNQSIHAGNYNTYAPTLSGTGATGNWNISAASLTTPRTLTIGSTGKTFNGTSDVSWSLNEIGAQATLVSTTNIKTINGASILGSGDLTVTASGGATLSDAIAFSFILG